MQKRNLTPELIEIALPLLKAGVKPKAVADQCGIKREAVVRLCVRQRRKGVPIPIWQRQKVTPTGTMRELLASAGPVARSWLIDQTPEGGKLADTIGAILSDLAAEEIENATTTS
jgi:DNA-binding transcriptional regulator LsrR (DeoR family)